MTIFVILIGLFEHILKTLWFDLVFPPGTFTPLNVGLNQRQSTANQNNSEKTPIEDTERHQLISHGGKGEAGF